MKKKVVLVRTLHMELLVEQSFSVFVGNGYGKHPRAEHLGHLNISYDIYFVPKNAGPLYGIKCSYGCS